MSGDIVGGEHLVPVAHLGLSLDRAMFRLRLRALHYIWLIASHTSLARHDGSIRDLDMIVDMVGYRVGPPEVVEWAKSRLALPPERVDVRSLVGVLDAYMGEGASAEDGDDSRWHVQRQLDAVWVRAIDWRDELIRSDGDDITPIASDLAQLGDAVGGLGVVSEVVAVPVPPALVRTGRLLTTGRLQEALLKDLPRLRDLLTELVELIEEYDQHLRETPQPGIDMEALVVVARVDRLDDARKHLARSGTEPLIRLAQRFIDDPPQGTDNFTLNRVEANARVLVAALTDPEPSAVIVENATATLIELLQPSVQVGLTIACELEALDVPADEADAIGTELEAFVELATGLGVADAGADVDRANAVLDKLAAISDRLDEALEASPALSVTADERERRLIEARLKGDEAFAAEHRPQLRADAIRMVIKGTPALVVSGATGMVAWATGNLKMAGVTAVLTAISQVIKAAFETG